MKSLIFVILAILLINVSYAEGETQTTDCEKSVQESREAFNSKSKEVKSEDQIKKEGSESEEK